MPESLDVELFNHDMNELGRKSSQSADLLILRPEKENTKIRSCS